MFKNYFYSITIPKISQVMSMRGLWGVGKSRRASPKPGFNPVPCGALTVIGVSTLQGKSTEGGGKAAKANMDVKSRGDVRLLPQAIIAVKSRGEVRWLTGLKSCRDAKGAKWLLN